MTTPFAHTLVDKVQGFSYKPPRKNNKGGYSSYINLREKGIDSVIFQTTPVVVTVEEDHTRMCRAPFGISDPRDDARDPTRLNLQLTPEEPGLLEFLQSFDEATITAATNNSAKWFKKSAPLSRAQIEMMYMRLISTQPTYPKDEHGNEDLTKEPFKPHFRVKVNLGERNTTKFLVAKPKVDKSTGAPVLDPETGEQKYVFKPVKASEASARMPKHSRIVAVCRVKGLWFMSSQFGTNIDATQVIIYPSSSSLAPELNDGGKMEIDDEESEGEEAEHDIDPREEAADYNSANAFGDPADADMDAV